jgi:hypothetical protein
MRQFIIGTFGLTVLLLSTAAWSNTITVMKDGTGDYTLLQPAADAAAAGDTLLIGPGRYEEVTEFYFNSGVRRDAHIVVRVDDLTIMGMDRDTVIIGPLVPTIAQGDPVGLVVAQNVSVTHIEKLTFENTWYGVYSLGDFYAENCAAHKCTGGFGTEGPLDIENSNIYENKDGIRAFYTAGLIHVGHCEVTDNSGVGINLASPQRAEISDTHIMGGGAGIQFDNCPGFIKDCVIEHIAYEGIILAENATVVTVADNTLRENGWHFAIGNYATVDAHQNQLLDSQLYGVWIRSPCTVVAHENDLISSQGYLVYLSGHLVSGIKHYDFTGNYWSTTDPDTIADRIWDNNDFNQVQAVIDFTPFAGEPVPAEATSFGKLKAKFQGQH